MDESSNTQQDPAADRPPSARRRLHVPMAAALAGLGILGGAADAAAAIARPDVIQTQPFATVTGIDVLANDTIGPGVTFTSTPFTSLGTFAVVPGPHPTLTFKASPGGFLGAQIVPYCIGDAQGNACSYLYVTVTNTQSFAIASDDAFTTQQDRPLRNLRVLANDTFNPFSLGISHLLSEQAAGNVSVSPDSQGGYGTWQPLVSPSPPINTNAWMLDYTPPPGFAGTDSFQYCIGSFAGPGTQTCATVFVEVLAAPAAVPGLGGFALAGLSGVLGWLGTRLRRRG